MKGVRDDILPVVGNRISCFVRLGLKVRHARPAEPSQLLVYFRFTEMLVCKDN